MKLGKQPKNNSDRKKAQSSSGKIKTFSRSYDFTPPEKASSFRPVPDDPYAYQHTGGKTETLSRTGPVSAQEWITGDDPERIELQDTLWTEDKFTIRFVDHEGRLLYSCEVSYGEKPVFRGPLPYKQDDNLYSYSFAGWMPEIVHATKNATYTSKFTPSLRVEEEPVDVPASAGETAAVLEPSHVTDSLPDVPTGSEQRKMPKTGAAAAGRPEADTESEREEKSEEAEEPDSEEDTFSEYWSVYEEADGQDQGSSADGIAEPGDDTGDDAVEEDSLSGPGSENETEKLPEPEEESDDEQPVCLFPRLESNGKKAMTAVWRPAEHADGYELFLAPCGTEFGRVTQTLSSEETAYTFRHLEKKAVYKMRLRAFSMTGGQKKIICEEPVLFCIAGGSNRKYTNAQEISIRHASLDLAVGEKKKLSATLIGQEPEKEVLTRGSALRYRSDHPEIASVSKEGKIEGLSVGSCRIWLTALNGICTSVGITVHEAPQRVAFKKKKYSLDAGNTINLKKKLKSRTVKNDPPMKWKSSDRSVAEINQKGILTALKKGKITVRVKTGKNCNSKVKIRVISAKKASPVPWKSVGAGKKRS